MAGGGAKQKRVKEIKAKLVDVNATIKSNQDAESEERRVRRLLKKLRDLDLDIQDILATRIPKHLKDLKKKWVATNQELANEIISTWREMYTDWKKQQKEESDQVRGGECSSSNTSSSISTGDKKRRKLQMSLPPENCPPSGEGAAPSATRYTKGKTPEIIESPIIVDEFNRNKIPSLKQLCTQILKDHIRKVQTLSATLAGRLPTNVLQTCLHGCTAEHLAVLERNSPYITKDTDFLWEKHYRKHFGIRNLPENPKSWREEFQKRMRKREAFVEKTTKKLARKSAQRREERERNLKTTLISGCHT